MGGGEVWRCVAGMWVLENKSNNKQMTQNILMRNPVSSPVQAQYSSSFAEHDVVAAIVLNFFDRGDFGLSR